MESERRATPVPSAGEAIAIVAICFGWFIWLSVAAVFSGFPTGGTFNDGSLLELILYECAFGAAALILLKLRGYALSELLPAPSRAGCIAGILLCVVATLAASMVGAQAAVLAGYGSQPIDAMVAQSHPSLWVVIALSAVNGLYEEIFLLGYLVRGFRSHGAALALGISLLVRLLYHLYQGPIGAVSVLVFGALVSLFYWRTQALWPVVVAHALADIVGLVDY
jgi:membrane protease YdiL (CAAX protease family)